MNHECVAITDLSVASDSPERNFEDDVHLPDSEGVLPGSHVSGLEPAAVDAHVHLQELNLARNQRVDVPRHVPADGVVGEDDATCSQWKTALQVNVLV